MVPRYPYWICRGPLETQGVLGGSAWDPRWVFPLDLGAGAAVFRTACGAVGLWALPQLRLEVFLPAVFSCGLPVWQLGCWPCLG